MIMLFHNKFVMMRAHKRHFQTKQSTLYTFYAVCSCMLSVVNRADRVLKMAVACVAPEIDQSKFLWCWESIYTKYGALKDVSLKIVHGSCGANTIKRSSQK